MAVVNTKATLITNRDSIPVVLSAPILGGGVLKEAVGTVETTATDEAASVYRFASIASNARVSQLLLYSDDIGTTTTADFGLYRTTADGGAVVDANLFTTAVSLKDGALNAVDITHQSAVFNIDDVEKPLWSALGLTADPSIMYDICATLVGAADAAGTISLKVRYV